MPFGDNVQVYQAKVSREEFAAGPQKVPQRRVKVESVEAPWWWSEYLTDEWKRRNRVDQPRRDLRTRLQRADADWGAMKFRWSQNDPHFVSEPKHAIWERP